MTSENGRRALPGMGMAKGLWVTLATMFRTILLPKKHLATVNYPKERETPVPRARGVIALDQEACTVCMLCSRQCPDWCIYTLEDISFFCEDGSFIKEQQTD